MTVPDVAHGDHLYWERIDGAKEVMDLNGHAPFILAPLQMYPVKPRLRAADHLYGVSIQQVVRPSPGATDVHQLDRVSGLLLFQVP